MKKTRKTDRMET